MLLVDPSVSFAVLRAPPGCLDGNYPDPGRRVLSQRRLWWYSTAKLDVPDRVGVKVFQERNMHILHKLLLSECINSSACDACLRGYTYM